MGFGTNVSRPTHLSDEMFWAAAEALAAIMHPSPPSIMTMTQKMLITVMTSIFLVMVVTIVVLMIVMMIVLVMMLMIILMLVYCY